MINFKAKLSERIGMDDIHEILRLTQQSNKRKQELYNLMMGEDEKIGYHAAWIFTHFSPEANKWLYQKQDELIDEVMVCEHGGKRRCNSHDLIRQLCLQNCHFLAYFSVCYLSINLSCLDM